MSESESDSEIVINSLKRKNTCETRVRENGGCRDYRDARDDGDGAGPSKRSRAENASDLGQVIERLTQHVSEIQNFLYFSQMPPDSEMLQNSDSDVDDSVNLEPEPKPDMTEPKPDTSVPLEFAPFATRLKDPNVLPTSQNHLALLNSLQHFGTEDWNNVRYFDTQKLYCAKPGYVDLEVNDEAKMFASDIRKLTLLNSEEKFLGATTHALVTQNDCLQKCLVDLMSWVENSESINVTDLRSKLKEIFTGDYVKVTRDCLQLVCGRRADIINQKREAVLDCVKDKFQRESLKKIPPSQEYLFDKKPFSDFVTNCGGVNKVFAAPKSLVGNKKQLPGTHGAKPGPSDQQLTARPWAPFNNYKNMQPDGPYSRKFFGYPQFSYFEPNYHQFNRGSYRPRKAGNQQFHANKQRKQESRGAGQSHAAGNSSQYRNKFRKY